MTLSANFSGAYTALATPFTEQGALDEAAFAHFIDWQIAGGIHGIVPAGTTGESATLSPEEHHRVVSIAVRQAAGRVKVMAGAGSNATAEAIDYSKHAEKVGADALLVVAPYYNKPTQEGIFQHYRAIASATGLPIFVYNIPGRSVVNIADETLARLAEACPNIVGVKDATGDLARVSTLRKLVGDRLIQFSGEDMTAIGFNAMGGRGVISVTSNIAPHHVATIQNLTLAGKYEEARTLHDGFIALHQAMFVETSPAPVKYALSKLGLCKNHLRLPMVPATKGACEKIDALMSALNLKADHGATSRHCA